MIGIIRTLAVVVAVLPSATALADHSDRHMQVFKSPSCGCCTAWAEIARKHGFDVTVEERDDMTPIKRAAGVTEDIGSCHTAKIGGYVVEGHVPMEAVDRLLSERPNVAGIAAPGMPAGSPGMGDDPAARFDILSFGGDRTTPDVYFKAGAE